MGNHKIPSGMRLVFGREKPWLTGYLTQMALNHYLTRENPYYEILTRL
ncbi:MAG: hypothetical protein QXS37_05015 [Candidatus Aenigmatarchaeota archaeon]